MKYRRFSLSCAFSLVEVTLALGVAGFCLIAVVGLLPISANTNQAAIQQTTANAIISQIAADLSADVRLPPGQASKEEDQGLKLHGHWAAVATPDTLFFTNEGQVTGNVNQSSPPSNAVFRAIITYRLPPTDTTSVADIRVSWPAAQNDQTKVAGSVGMFVAINRK